MKNFLFKTKKGAIDVQFNWIFVLIIGTVILLFFISVMKSSEKSSTSATYQSLSIDLDSLLSQTEIDSGNLRNIILPNIAIIFKCEEFGIEKASSTHDIKYKTIFSPNRIQGKALLTQTVLYKKPYPVDNFLIMTSNQVRYNFVTCPTTMDTVKCNKLIDGIIKYMPLNATVKRDITSSTVQDNNNYKERFIFISQSPSGQSITGLKDMKDKDVTAIYINSLDPEQGDIQYYEKNGNVFSSSSKLSTKYLGIEMLAGAVVSDYNIYNCNVNKSMSKFKIITTIYSNRTKVFKNEYSNAGIGTPEYTCYTLYQSIDLTSTLNDIKTWNFVQISTNANDLEKLNKDSLLNSCPSIY